jgi:hypothetical protein
MTRYISTTLYLNSLIANQGLNYRRNDDEIRYSQEKSLVPWTSTELIKQPVSVFGHVKGVVTGGGLR